MKAAFLCFLVGASLVAAEPVFEQSRFEAAANGRPADWVSWAPRTENAPRLFVDASHNVGGPGSLGVSGNSNPAVLGGWERTVPGVRGGHWYRFRVRYQATGTGYEPREVIVRLDWRNSAGKRAGRPDYAWRTASSGDWTTISMDAPAPGDATGVAIQLLLWDAPRATVWWDDVALAEIETPEPRRVTVASINLTPKGTKSSAASVSAFLAAIEKSVKPGADLILLPEGITVVGTGKTYAEVAETIPGPTTRRLGEVARKRKAYIAAGIYEREGATVYNTAVLLGRDGELVGKYRKVYIPREETEGGISPGSDYPVFETDFGKVGMMICWDVQYADPARGLALGGAEIILMPIWGGNNTLAEARAIENHVFLASSGYGHPTRILDPDGEILAIADEEGSAAIATIDLNKRYADPWLGDMRGRFRKELRLDVPVEPMSQRR